MHCHLRLWPLKLPDAGSKPRKIAFYVQLGVTVRPMWPPYIASTIYCTNSSGIGGPSSQECGSSLWMRTIANDSRNCRMTKFPTPWMTLLTMYSLVTADQPSWQTFAVVSRDRLPVGFISLGSTLNLWSSRAILTVMSTFIWYPSGLGSQCRSGWSLELRPPDIRMERVLGFMSGFARS